jgi:glycosyltransferase involved in cell wall biosynthesis
MKLVYIANVCLPLTWAHSIQIMKMCEAFAQIGLEVELATGMKREAEEKIFAYYNIKNKFKITKIPYFDLSAEGPSKINFLIRSFSFLLCAKLYVIFKKYDILYVRAPLAGLFFNNYYLEVHQLPLKLKIWHKIAFRKAKKVIVLTRFLKQKLVASGVDEAKIIIAADAVDLAEFRISLAKNEARHKLSLPMDKKIIIYAGNFSFHNWKGVDVLLDSLKYLPGVVCLLVGGDLGEKNEIKKRYPAEEVIITGHKIHSEVPAYLKAADALILPNKKGNQTSAYYTSPLKLFEYMASERPIVASDLPSIREVLNETNAVLVKSDNPEVLAQGIKQILADSQLADKLARQAFSDVRNCTWQKRVEKILSH